MLDRRMHHVANVLVIAATMCDPFPNISSLPHAATSCVTDTIYPFPASCTVMCDTGWTASSGVSETSYVCQPDGSWVNTRAVVCNGALDAVHTRTKLVLASSERGRCVLCRSM